MMLTQQVRIDNRLGVHTRASAKLVDLASRFVSRITIHYQGRSADAKRILELMLLAIPYDALIELQIEGEDQADALAALVALIQDKFGEAK